MITTLYRNSLLSLSFLLAGYLLWLAWLSLAWPLSHPAARSLYFATLWSGGVLPYRDFLLLQAPGGVLLGRVALELNINGAVAARIVDILAVAMLGVASASWLRPGGRLTAVLAALLVAISGLHHSVAAGLAPELWLPVFLISALLVLRARKGDLWGHIGAGLLMSVVILMQPAAALAAPIVGYYGWRQRTPPAPRLGSVAFFLAMLLPPALALLIYTEDGGGSAVISVLQQATLLRQLDASGRLVPRMALLEQSISAWQRLGGHGLWLLPATLGILVTAVQHNGQRRLERYLMAGLGISLALLPFIQGRFDALAWWPALSFWLMLAAVSLQPGTLAGRVPRWAPLLVLLFVIGFRLQPPAAFIFQVTGYWERQPPIDTAREGAHLLEAYVEGEAKVQPISSGARGIAALWHAGVRPGTRFPEMRLALADGRVPQVAAFRRALLKEMERTSPEWLLLDGAVLSNAAAEPFLEQLVAEYELVDISANFRLYRRNGNR